MGVTGITNRVSYSGNGSSTVFPFAYEFFNQSDLQVYIFDQGSSIIYPQVLNINYTVSGNQNAQNIYPGGGNVIMNSAVPANLELVILRSPPLVQNYALIQNQGINSVALVQQLDYLTLLVQRMQDQVSRCVILPDGLGPLASGSGFSTVLPSNIGSPAYVANAPLLVNSGATGFTVGGLIVGTSAFVGVLPIVNGGTGQTFLPVGVLYGGSSLSAILTNSSGLPLVSNSAGTPPSFQPLAASLFADGNSSAPSIAFTNEPTTGFYRAGAKDVVFQVGGAQILEWEKSTGSSINIAFGIPGTISNSISNPVTFQSDWNGQQLFTFYNSNQGPSSITTFSIQNGSPSTNNATTIENWANNTANTYLGGGSLVGATAFQSFLNITSESATGSIRFNVGGRTPATERARLGLSQFSLATNVSFGLAGAASSVVSVMASGAITPYTILVPTAPGVPGQVWTYQGSSVSTWNTPAASPTNSYYAGYLSGATWSTSSTNFNDPTTVTGTSILTQRRGNITVSTPSNHNPAITFTPAAANSVYRIVAMFQGFNDAAAGDNAGFLMTDGSINIVTAGYQAPAISNGTAFFCMDGIYAFQSGSSQTIKIQAATGGAGTTSYGTVNVGSGAVAMEWNIIQLL